MQSFTDILRKEITPAQKKSFFSKSLKKELNKKFPSVPGVKYYKKQLRELEKDE